jgi:predicted transcriptional regulator
VGLGRRKWLKRSRFDIVAGIVQDCFLPKNKTQIMYKSNLSFPQVNKYLDLLAANRLILPEKAKYRTTGKGQEFLVFYDHLVRLLDSSSQLEGRDLVPDGMPLITQGSNLVIRCVRFNSGGANC